MNVTFAKGFSPDLFIEQLEKSKIAESSGRVTFSAFGHKQNTALLYGCLEFPSELPEVDGRIILNKAVDNVSQRGAITAKTLLAEINKQTAEYFKRSKKSYYLATSISVHWSTELPPLRVKGMWIRFERQLPKRYVAEQAKIFSEAERTLLAQLPNDYYLVRIRVRGRSIYEAADVGLDALDLVRGIWNWYYNRSHPSRMSFGQASPVNELVLGPVHTLHELSGKLASETYWYEPSYRAPVSTFQVNNFSSLEEFYVNIRRALKRCKYSSDIEQAIIRYTRALDDRDWNSAFLKLWGLLEYLTNSTKQPKDMTIRRTAFVFRNQQYSREILRQLGEYRNRTVHANVSTHEIETYMYWAE